MHQDDLQVGVHVSELSLKKLQTYRHGGNIVSAGRERIAGGHGLCHHVGSEGVARGKYGVAGRLVRATSRPDTSERWWRCGDHGHYAGLKNSVEMSYLSTARGGTVIVTKMELQKAMEVTRELFGDMRRERERRRYDGQ